MDLQRDILEEFVWLQADQAQRVWDFIQAWRESNASKERESAKAYMQRRRSDPAKYAVELAKNREYKARKKAEEEARQAALKAAAETRWQRSRRASYAARHLPAPI